MRKLLFVVAFAANAAHAQGGPFTGCCHAWMTEETCRIACGEDKDSGVSQAALAVFTPPLSEERENSGVNGYMKCSGGAGGPGAATATLMLLRSSIQGQYSVEMSFKNTTFPNGIQGSYAAIQGQNRTIEGDGTLAGLNSNMVLTLNAKMSTYNLTIYADGNDRVEFGYGVDLICKDSQISKTRILQRTEGE